MPDGTKVKSAKLFTCPLLAGALVAAAIPAPDAAADIFLRITAPDIIGESVDAKHKNEIDVTSFSAGFGGFSPLIRGAAANLPSCGPVHFTHNLDLASVPLADAVMKGTMLGKAVFTFRSTGGAAFEYYVVTLSNALVSSLQQSTGGERPTEAVELLPGIVQLTYTPQSGAGVPGTPVTATVDCKR